MNEQEIREIIRDELIGFIRAGRFGIKKDNVGIQIGSQTTEKIGLYGVTPVVRASAISAPSGGVTQDAEARTAINSIRTALTNLGVTA